MSGHVHARWKTTSRVRSLPSPRGFWGWNSGGQVPLPAGPPLGLWKAGHVAWSAAIVGSEEPMRPPRPQHASGSRDSSSALPLHTMCVHRRVWREKGWGNNGIIASQKNHVKKGLKPAEGTQQAPGQTGYVMRCYLKCKTTTNKNILHLQYSSKYKPY